MDSRFHVPHAQTTHRDEYKIEWRCTVCTIFSSSKWKTKQQRDWPQFTRTRVATRYMYSLSLSPNNNYGIIGYNTNRSSRLVSHWFTSKSSCLPLGTYRFLFTKASIRNWPRPLDESLIPGKATRLSPVRKSPELLPKFSYCSWLYYLVIVLQKL